MPQRIRLWRWRGAAAGVAAAFEVAFDDPYDEERQIEQEDLQRSRALGWEPPASPEYYCETGP